jgi:hypothetical protein
MVELLVGALVVAFLGVLAFGLATRRIAWRQQACCAPADPARDLRMRDTAPDQTTPRSSA